MSIISQETWDKFTEEEKDRILTMYKEELRDSTDTDLHAIDRSCSDYAVKLIKAIFGEKNLQPKPKIRTWNDVKMFAPSLLDFKIETPVGEFYDKLHDKMVASYKIGVLIDLGYGGVVTEEEWRDENAEKWSVLNNHNFGDFDIAKMVVGFGWKSLISFHTRQQAEEFMSHSENVELVKQYYMV